MADDVIRSLLKQLVYQMNFRDAPKALGKIYDLQRERGKSAEPETDAFIDLLVECLTKFCVVFILIDAFDECADEERLKVLADLQRLPLDKIRLFLTGRTHVLETRELRNDGQLQLWLKNASHQPILASNEDIGKYLTQELEQKAKGSQFENIRAQIVTKISQQANGQYALLHLCLLTADFCSSASN